MCLDASQNKSYPTTDLPVKNGLLIWLDASDDTTFSYSSGTEVSQWRDKSGNNFHANQATTANQPSRSSFINSRKGVNFTSTNGDFMRVSSGIVTPNYITLFAVVRPATQDNSYAIIMEQDHGNGYNGWVIQRNGAGSFWQSWVASAASTWLNPNQIAYTDNTSQIVTLRKNASTINLYSNGTSSSPVSISDTVITQTSYGLNLGYWQYGGGRYYNGVMCEILVFNRGLSDTELKQVNTYLGQKWGISNTDRSIIDLSGNDDNGLLGAGTAAYMPAYDYYNKGSLRFDGSDDYVDLGTNAALTSLTNNITVEAWIKIPISTNRYTIYGNGYSGTGMMFGTSANTPGGLEVYYPSIYVAYSTAGVLQPDVWQHVVYTRNGSGLNTHAFYINGVSQTVTQTANGGDSWGTSGTNRYLGLRGGVMFNGQMSSVKVYSRALNAAEIAQNYEAQKSRFVNTIVQQGLVLNLDAGNPYSYAGSGTTWYDVSGNNYSGSLTNGPVYNTTNGGVIVFDGSNDYVVSSNFTPNFSTKTLSGWVKLSSISQQGGGLITLQSIDGLVFDSIVYNETGQGWGFGSNGFSRTGWSNVLETSTSEWVNITATYENSNYRLYRNGTLIQTLTSFGALNFNFNSNVQLGYRHLGSSGYLAATISQGFVYNRTLSAAEVLQNYNATKGRFGL
jgi:hypothetical protein